MKVTGSVYLLMRKSGRVTRKPTVIVPGKINLQASACLVVSDLWQYYILVSIGIKEFLDLEKVDYIRIQLGNALLLCLPSCSQE